MKIENDGASSACAAEVAMNLVVNEDLSWHVFVHGSDIPSDISPLLSLPQSVQSLSALSSILQFVGSCNICTGNSNDKFKVLVDRRKGKFMDQLGM